MDTFQVPMKYLVDAYNLLVEKEKEEDNTTDLKNLLDDILENTEIVIGDMTFDSQESQEDTVKNSIIEMLNTVYLDRTTHITALISPDITSLLDNIFSVDNSDLTVHNTQPFDKNDAYQAEEMRDMVRNKNVLTSNKNIPNVASEAMKSLTYIYEDENAPFGFGFEILYNQDDSHMLM